jgi:hypothetical protein
MSRPDGRKEVAMASKFLLASACVVLGLFASRSAAAQC